MKKISDSEVITLKGKMVQAFFLIVEVIAFVSFVILSDKSILKFLAIFGLIIFIIYFRNANKIIFPIQADIR